MNLFVLVISNLLAWLILHVVLSYACFKIPLSFFLKEKSIFNITKWEKDGVLWQQLFRVRIWKNYLIDGSSIAKKSYDKSHLHGTKEQALKEFTAETKRAELTHWVLLFSVCFFFLWNPPWAAWLNVLYAIISNVPFIVTQRYNRARLNLILKKKRLEQNTFIDHYTK